MLPEVLNQNGVQDVRDRRDSEIIAFGNSAGLATCCRMAERLGLTFEEAKVYLCI